MRPLRVAVAVVVALVASSAVLAIVACSTFSASGAADAATDAAVDGAVVGEGGEEDGGVIVVPACKPGEVMCNGVCVTGLDCHACANANLLCDATRACAADCTACPGAPIECVACDSSQENPIGTCRPADAGTFCLNGAYDGGAHCNCNNGEVNDCIAGSQVCIPASSTDWCVTCGEVGAMTDGLGCKNGKICNTSLSPPSCK